MIQLLSRLDIPHPEFGPFAGVSFTLSDALCTLIIQTEFILKGNSGIFKPRPYFCHEIRSSTHREQFGESRRPSEDI